MMLEAAVFLKHPHPQRYIDGLEHFEEVTDLVELRILQAEEEAKRYADARAGGGSGRTTAGDGYTT